MTRDDDRNMKVESRLTKIEEALVGLKANVATLLVAIVGTSENPGGGILLRMDRLEQRQKWRSRFAWSALGFSAGLIIVIVRELMRNWN